MKIYIMRHGEAAFDAPSDQERPLTIAGQHQVHTIGEQLKSEKIHFDYALVSPYLRAKETLQTLNHSVNISQTIVEPELTPGGDPQRVVDHLLARAGEHDHCLLVSHLPMVSYLVEALTTERRVPMFSTAEIICIEILEGERGELLWVKKV